jgi:hypothetical protein
MDNRRLSGNGGQFDDAMGKFALAYADQAERDHAARMAAVRNGIIDVQLEHLSDGSPLRKSGESR